MRSCSRDAGPAPSQWEQGSWKAELGNDYLVIAHSAARALAKELGCRDGGELPEQPAGLPAAAP
ncbi:hypothetical protein ACFYZ4_23930 [Streptomyces sp. NPDC001513]|uniref:hypothetical protein n=1 Tax=Streptomyces sp. NPDC001513 TaxID=3364580 RepID=UPI0036AAFC66